MILIENIKITAKFVFRFHWKIESDPCGKSKDDEIRDNVDESVGVK